MTWYSAQVLMPAQDNISFGVHEVPTCQWDLGRSDICSVQQHDCVVVRDRCVHRRNSGVLQQNLPGTR